MVIGSVIDRSRGQREGHGRGSKQTHNVVAITKRSNKDQTIRTAGLLDALWLASVIGTRVKLSE